MIAYIWAGRSAAPDLVWLLAVWLLVSLRLRGDPDDWGFSAAALRDAWRDWRRGYAAGAAALLVALVVSGPSTTTLLGGVFYFLFCVVQQTVLQGLIRARLRDGLGGVAAVPWIAGALFGATHWPNAFLVPATFVWGAASVWLYERRPSVPALAGAQVILSTAVYWTVPEAWVNGLRVGPG